MWTTLEANEKSVVVGTGTPPAKAMSLNHGRAWMSNVQIVPQLDASHRVEWQDIAARLASLRDEVAGQFVERNELADAVATAMAAGEHMFVLGPVGSAKSALIRSFARGIGGEFFRVVMNPDLPRDALMGALDPQALQQGKWDRLWAGIAKADVAFLDEIFRASAQVSNILLDALEERAITSANGDRPIPLLTAMTAANDVPSDRDYQAVWDRLTVRLSVNWIADANGFRRMLHAAGGRRAVAPALSPDEIMLLASTVEARAQFDQELTPAMVELWGQFRNQASDRRWQRTLKMAFAAAAIEGTAPEPRHLAVARWTLWQEPDEEGDIADMVLGLTDPTAGQVLNLEALLADLQSNIHAAISNGADAAAKTALVRQARDLGKEARDIVTGNGGHIDRASAVVAGAKSALDSLVGSI